MALLSLLLLSCTKQSISVLRSSKLVILCIEVLTWLALQKSSKTWKFVFCIANNISFHEKETFFMYLSFDSYNCINQLSLSEKEAFSICGLAFSFLLSCTKQSISVLRSSKLVILCIEALTWLALQKSSKTWKFVFCIANNFSFHEKETSFMYLSFTLIIA